MATSPINVEDQAVLEKLMKDENVRQWLDAQRPRSALKNFLLDKDTLRILLTAVVVPLLGWLAIVGYAAVDANIHQKERDDAAKVAAAKIMESETRVDVERVAALLPYLSGTDVQKRWSIPALEAMAKTSNNEFSAQMFASLRAEAARGTTSDNAEVKSDSVQTLEIISPSKITTPLIVPAKPSEGTPELNQSIALTQPKLAYIQYYGAAQGGQAKAVVEAFRAAGVPVPGMEDVLEKHHDTACKFPQRGTGAIRYFSVQDEGAARYAANLLAKTMNSAPPQLRLLNLKQQPGVIEIWLPAATDVCASGG